MSDFRVASRYAKSLLNLAIEQKTEEALKDDVQSIANTFKENRSLVIILKNPIIKYEKKLVILKRLFESGINPMMVKFFELLARKNRADILPDITYAWLELYNKYKNIIKANVVSAVTLSEEEKKKIVEKVANYTQKSVILDEHLDPDLIGGFVLRVGDEQLDNSIAGKINALKRNFAERV